ncbi:unnamed protein product [Hermetia illucens]|uniref:Nucleoside phosphorylase domain-containing protein n=1 Tax=Hermetia illucens TaxID=343691 RepID=A0A7R8YTG4_HERIL|nr:uridine phosphorylase 2-like [Hermetia illucens]XP_037912892.1 uridine phosphorylase 2-like [Hermetia illucens]XP_037912893.1 uridine phosphorylase 2-like [Hermetia illucens]XP_037912894.1 uridine phosphorylase 2-like [Hermetia illucens]CAD7084499.1 unnamed protein product [Hermetia illucens]
MPHTNGLTNELPNPYLKNLDNDVLYHLGFSKKDDLKKLFGDVKFVCTGGSADRMREFAYFIYSKLKGKLPVEDEIKDLGGVGHRYALYKVGPVISVSHGMGFGSIGILLHEMIKLVRYAECDDPIFIRVGTCGGIGIPPGTVVVTEGALNGVLKGVHEFIILGKRVERPATFDQALAQKIQECALPADNFKIVLGKTIGTDDFYEGQGRTDGAICDHKIEEKMEFLQKVFKLGVRNFEMEAPVFGALTHHAGIKGAIICASLVNRLNGDQITATREEMHDWGLRAQEITWRFIEKTLKDMALIS